MSSKRKTVDKEQQLTFSALVEELGRSLSEAQAIFDILPDALLTDEQAAQIREWGAPVVDEQAESDKKAIIRLMALELIDSAKREAMIQHINRLVLKCIQSNGRILPKDPEEAAYVRKLAEMRGKPQPLSDGKDAALAEQIQIIDGEVVLPEIQLPKVEMQTPAELSGVSQPIAQLPADQQQLVHS